MSELLPDEINFHIMLYKSYQELLQQATLNQKFNNLLQSETFWRAKAMKDFEITNGEYNTILQDLTIHNHNLVNPIANLAREAYIRISAEQSIYVPGAEFYGNLGQLTADTVKKGEFNYFKHLVSHYKILGVMAQKAAYRADSIKYVDQLIASGYVLYDIGFVHANATKIHGSLKFLEDFRERYESVHGKPSRPPLKVVAEMYGKHGTPHQIKMLLKDDFDVPFKIDSILKGALTSGNLENIVYMSAINSLDNKNYIQYAAMSGDRYILDYMWNLVDIPEETKYSLALMGAISERNNIRLFTDLLNEYVKKYGALSRNELLTLMKLSFINDRQILAMIFLDNKDRIDADFVAELMIEVYDIPSRDITKNLGFFINLITNQGIVIKPGIIEQILYNLYNWGKLGKLFYRYLETHPIDLSIFFYGPSGGVCSSFLYHNIEKVKDADSLKIYGLLFDSVTANDTYVDKLLSDAAQHDNLYLFKFFLNRGADISTAIKHISTPQIQHFVRLHYPGLI